MKITIDIPEPIEKDIKKYLREHGVSLNEQSIINMALWLSYKEFGGNIKGFFEHVPTLSGSVKFWVHTVKKSIVLNAITNG